MQNEYIDIPIQELHSAFGFLMNCTVTEAGMTLDECVEKQIAKKTTDIDNELNTFKCPSCQHTLIALDDITIHKHCLLCGQKLDWGNEDAE